MAYGQVGSHKYVHSMLLGQSVPSLRSLALKRHLSELDTFTQIWGWMSLLSHAIQLRAAGGAAGAAQLELAEGAARAAE